MPPDQLVRISGSNTNEPYFGRSGGNRFDDDSRSKTKRFGTCYLGTSLTVAFAESVLHGEEPVGGQFIVADSEITRRFAVSFAGPDLRLAKLTGASLKRLGGNADLTGTPDYKLPQQWARAIVAHPDNVDGFMYMSRHINDEIAVVLFERDAAKSLDLTMTDAVPLHTHVDFLRTIATLCVRPY